jgi:Secreted protein containing C-terminal beta-propeller domain distantly related to WD-40 repeats
MKKIRHYLALITLVAVFTVVIILPNIKQVASEELTQEQSLPTVGTVENLRSILTEAENSRALMGQGMITGTDDLLRESLNKSAPSAPASSGLGESSDYSTTNLQVAGVDEADIIKNDGKYIYQVNNQELIIAQAYPSDQMSVVSRIAFKQGEFRPQELYVDDQYLVLIGNAFYQGECEPCKPDMEFQQNSKEQLYPPIHYWSTSKVIIYDLTDKTNLKKLREVELDGMYVSSRKVGSNLYFIANKYLDTYRILKQGLEPPLPSYRDTVGKEEFVTIGYNDIHYFPNCVEPNYLLVAALDLNQRDQKMQFSSYLGSGQNIYTSTSNLYVAVTQYQLPAKPDQPASTSQLTPEPQPAPDSASPSFVPGLLKPNSMITTTVLYKFGLTTGGTTFKVKGEVPGIILNQFAMDENNGYFRIATTTGEIWRTDEFTSKNNVYILDQALQLMGKIEDIAPGEKIYSVRFMGDRGYLVTFKNVDPFYVLDLKNPSAPAILGALKIPGFSDYLQPYDENHIIGFGKETVEINQNAFYQGLKLAVFDVTDVNHPIEMFKTVIGDRGTDSEVLHNHKALLFDKEKGILAFPVTLMEIKNPGEVNSPKNIPEYGQFTFQGAYIYELDLLKGFTLRGKITHLQDEDLFKAGQHYFDNSKMIERIIFIKDTLFTVSQKMIKANDFTSLQEKNSLILRF